MVTRQLSPLVYCNENQLSGNSNFVRSRTNPDICLHFPRYTPTHRHFQRIYIIQTMVAFFLACEDFGRMFDNSFPACAFFFKLEICFRTLIYPNDARPLIHPPIPTSQNPHPSLSPCTFLFVSTYLMEFNLTSEDVKHLSTTVFL